jgi:hypothetical protein
VASGSPCSGVAVFRQQAVTDLRRLILTWRRRQPQNDGPKLELHSHPMLCRRCDETCPDDRPPYAPAMRVGAVAGVLCARCGGVLAPEDLTLLLVAKLAQLNRFGLAGGVELLRPAPPTAKDS